MTEPIMPPENTTDTAMLRSLSGVQAAKSVLHDGNTNPSPAPTITRRKINAFEPPFWIANGDIRVHMVATNTPIKQVFLPPIR